MMTGFERYTKKTGGWWGWPGLSPGFGEGRGRSEKEAVIA